MKYLLALGGPLYFLPLSGGQGQCAMPVAGDSYRFLNPRVVGYDSRAGTLLPALRYRIPRRAQPPANRQRTDNVAEWHERFCDQAEPEDIDAIVYGDNLNQLQELRRLHEPTRGQATGDLPPDLQANSFARHLLEANCVEVLDYLIYAKQASPSSPPRPTPSSDPSRTGPIWKIC